MCDEGLNDNLFLKILTRIQKGRRRFLLRADRTGVATDIFSSEIATVRIVHAKEIDETFLTFFRNSSDNVVVG